MQRPLLMKVKSNPRRATVKGLPMRAVAIKIDLTARDQRRNVSFSRTVKTFWRVKARARENVGRVAVNRCFV